jgi:predicted adenine nucleotide alpha hydrolase (AANH) superfamily ATPase
MWIRRLPRLLGLTETVGVYEGAYDPGAFYGAVSGLEGLPEGSLRCRACFRLRLGVAASYAAERGYDMFATTLSVSPHKDAGAINELGADLSREHGVRFLSTDFKKRGGYQRSVELSKKLGLYRQRYCGCEFSLRPGAVKAMRKEWT